MSWIEDFNSGRVCAAWVRNQVAPPWTLPALQGGGLIQVQNFTPVPTQTNLLLGFKVFRGRVQLQITADLLLQPPWSFALFLDNPPTKVLAVFPGPIILPSLLMTGDIFTFPYRVTYAASRG